MNILLTGGAGYIGSHTIIELDKAGHSVVVVDNLVNSNPESLKRVAKIIGKEIPFYEVDVRNKKDLSKVFIENKFDAVIHFAGLKAVGESVSKPLEYYLSPEVLASFGLKPIPYKEIGPEGSRLF